MEYFQKNCYSSCLTLRLKGFILVFSVGFLKNRVTLKSKIKTNTDWFSHYWADRNSVWVRVTKDNNVEVFPGGQNILPLPEGDALDLGELPTSLISAVYRVRKSKATEWLQFTGRNERCLSARVEFKADASVFIDIDLRCQPNFDWSRYDGFSVGVLIADASKNLVYANESAANLLGYSTAQEVLLQNPSELLHPDDWQNVKRLFAERRAEGSSHIEDVFRFRRREGGDKWLKAVVSPITDPNNVITHYISVIVSINEEKLIEHRLIRSEERLRSIFYRAQAGVVLTNSQGRIIAANSAFCEMVGFESEREARRVSLPEVTVAEDRIREKELFDDLLQNRRSHYRIEKRYTHQDGHTTWTDAIVSAIYEDGKDEPVNYISIVQNIQQAKENEQRMLALNELKDKFFSILSHDLKNPIAAVIGLSDLALHSAKEGKMDDVLEMLNMIQVSSNRVHDLLINVLDWSRSQQGSLTFSPEEVSLDAIIDEVSDLLELSCLQKEVNLITDIPSGTSIKADIHMLKSILLNLTTNALKYTERGGEIVIKVEKTGSGFFFSVEDSGIGMSVDQLERLKHMEPPQRSNGTEDEPGSGLGLILVKEFVQAHGSELMVVSEEGKGSTFSFYLPS